MKRFLSLLILALVAIASVVSCVKQEDIDNLQSQIDDIKSVQIATIDQQIAGIKTSLASLQETDKELKGYISTLQNTASELQRSINSTNDKIDRVEADLKKDLSDTQSNLANDIITAKTELLTSLTTLRTDMETQLAVINTNITNLQEKDAALEEKIDGLKTYVDGEIKNTKDWASATFATLEQYNALVTEIAGIKANITSINTAISELETRLNGKIASDIAAAVSTLEGELQQQATDITQAYKEAVATAKGEIETAYTNAIATAIASSESTMQAWVNGRLTGYYTIAEADAKLATLKQTLETKLSGQKEYLEGVISALETVLTEKIENNGTLIANLQTKVNGLRDDLSALAETVTTNTQTISQLRSNLTTAISDITSAYNSAISTAITENNGTINAKIAEDIATATNALQQQIDAINTRINNLESRVTTLETSVEELINRIQDIVVIPSYSDGSVACAIGANNEFYFEVLPSGSAARLAEAGKDIFTLKAVYTQTKAMPTFVNLPISSVRAEGDILVVTASASGLTITTEQSANAILTVTSGVSSISTGYYPLYFAASSLVVNATLSASTPFSASFSCNVSKTDGITEYGICYSEGTTLCDTKIYASSIDGDGNYSLLIEGLKPATTYYYKAYSVVGGLACYSVISSFTTHSLNGFVETVNAENISAFSVKLSGALAINSADGIIYGICFSNNNSTPTIANDYKTANNFANGNFSVSVYGLSPSTNYYYRAFAKAGNSVAYGNVLVFQTNESSDVVITGDYSNVTVTSATISGRLNIPEGTYSSIAYGFSFQGQLSWVNSKDSDGVFSVSKTGLSENYTYQYKAAVMVDGTIYYGETVSFTTKKITVSTEEAVDLGLSVLWASCNLGASSPDKIGNLYMWGDTNPSGSGTMPGYWQVRDDVRWTNYKYCLGTENTLTKYNDSSSYGMVDNKNVLEPNDDAATVLLEDGWRMPTQQECEELLSKCRAYAGSYESSRGVKVYNEQGLALFIPLRGDDGIYQGWYWSSSGSGLRANVMNFDIYENEYEGLGVGTILRPATLPIRPVKDK